MVKILSVARLNYKPPNSAFDQQNSYHEDSLVCDALPSMLCYGMPVMTALNVSHHNEN